MPKLDFVILSDVVAEDRQPISLVDRENKMFLVVSKQHNGDDGGVCLDMKCFEGSTWIPLEPLIAFFGPFFDKALNEHAVVMGALQEMIEEKTDLAVATADVDWRPAPEEVETVPLSPELLALQIQEYRQDLIDRVEKFNKEFPEHMIASPLRRMDLTTAEPVEYKPIKLTPEEETLIDRWSEPYLPAEVWCEPTS